MASRPRAVGRRFSIIVLALAASLGASGCGVLITGAIAGILAGTQGGGGGAAANNAPTTVPSAQVVGDKSSGTVTLELALADAESDNASIEVRYTLDANDASTKAFAKTATGSLKDLNGADVSASAVATSPSGTTYRFLWNTAKDLGTTLNRTARLQVLVGGAVGSTTATFEVDNTTRPMVVSATLGALPSGASVYADAQNAPGFIPVSLVIADAESTPTTLKVLYSTDGGSSFPETNVAVGTLLDASGQAVPLSSVPTSPGGTSYTFRFVSASNGLGSTSAQGVTLRFSVKDSKDNASPRDTAGFSVNNAAFSAIVSTPTGSQITDKVDVRYLLVDEASESIAVSFEYQLAPSPFTPATAVVQPPAPPTNVLPASPGGKLYHFFWNAFQDMVVLRGVSAHASATVRMFVTRPSTQVKRGPFPTTAFAVDHRLIYTVVGRNAGADDGVASTSAPVGFPLGIAYAAATRKVYFADPATRRVRVVDFNTGLIDTAVGGGFEQQSGTLAKDFGLGFTVGVAVQTAGSGALFVSDEVFVAGAVNGRVLRVDGSTPIVTRVVPEFPGSAGAIAYDPSANAVFYAEIDGGGVRRIKRVGPVGGPTTTVCGGGATALTDASTGLAPTNAALTAVDAIAAGGSVYPDIVLFTDSANDRVFALNVNPSTARTVLGISLPAQSVSTILSQSSHLALANAQVRGVAVAAPGTVYLTLQDAHRIVRFDESDPGTPKPLKHVAGSQQGIPGFSGEGGPAATAFLAAPTFVTPGDPGGIIFSDTGNTRVRQIVANGRITTVAGGFGDLGDLRPAALAKLGLPASVASTSVSTVVADALLSRVRRVDAATTTISTFAGTGDSGAPTGDGGPALQAVVSSPVGLAVGPAGEIYLSQRGSPVVRVVSGGTIQHVAGVPGTAAPATDGAVAASAPLDGPQALGFTQGALIVAQSGDVNSGRGGIVSAINLGSSQLVLWGVPIDPGRIVRIAGGTVGNAPPDLARDCALTLPIGVTTATNGVIYIADSGTNQVYRVDTAGNMTVVAGTGTFAFGGDGGPATAADLQSPTGVYLDKPLEQVLYIMDSGNQRVRAVNLAGPPGLIVNGVTIQPGNIGTIAGDGTAADPDDLGQDGVQATTTHVGLVGTLGSNMTSDGGGSVFFAEGLARRVRFVDPTGIVRTYAGLRVSDGDGLPSDNATLTRPTAILATPSGSYGVMDLGRIRFANPQNTIVTRVAGNAQQNYRGDGAPGQNAALDAGFSYRASDRPAQDVPSDGNGPRQLAYSGSSPILGPGVVLVAIADTLDHMVRLMNVGTATFDRSALLGFTLAPGEVKKLAGTVSVTNGFKLPQPGFAGDGLLVGGATAFDGPEGVAFTSSGLLIVADTNNNRIRAINLNATQPVFCAGLALPIGPGRIETIASGAGIVLPRNLAIHRDPQKPQVLVFQQGVNAPERGIFALSLHSMGGAQQAYGALLGSGAGARIGTLAPPFTLIGDFEVPRGVAVDPASGDAYCASRDANGVNTLAHTVVRIPFGGGLSEIVAGTAGSSGFSGDGSIATSAELASPFGVAVDGLGSIYILDGGNLRVRRCRRFP